MSERINTFEEEEQTVIQTEGFRDLLITHLSNKNDIVLQSVVAQSLLPMFNLASAGM